MSPEVKPAPIPARSEATVQEMLQMMDVVNALRTQQGEVEKQLSHDDQVADLRTRLRATYQQMGVQVDDITLDRAIRDQSAHKYEFQAPKRDFSYTLAQAYVDRARIGRQYGIPAAVLGMAGLTLWGLTTLGIAAYHRSQETDAEKAIESAYAQRITLERRTTELEKSALRKDLPPAEERELDSTLDSIVRELRETDSFFAAFCSQGTAADDVTADNYLKAGVQLAQVRPILTEAEVKAMRAQGIIEEQKKLQQTRQQLDAVIGSMQTAVSLPAFLGPATEFYNSGVKNVEQRQLSAAQQDLRRLQTINDDARQFQKVGLQVEQVYASITQIVREDSARQDANSWYREALAYKQSADVPRLRESVTKLQALDKILREEYTFKIVGARWRDHSSGARIYYAKVQAIDTNGQAIPTTIVHQETGVTYQDQKMWGEEILEENYERIKRDKEADQLLNVETQFGVKERGYRSWRVTLKDNAGRVLPRKGQITID